MAAVQQCTSTEAEPTKKAAFIESMEEEMRRCAEHLERRQSRRRPHRTSWERTNGFAEVEGSGSEAGASRKRRGNTLPRSFTLSTDQPEIHEGWQQQRNVYRHSPNHSSSAASRERSGRYTRTLSYEREAYGGRDRTPLSGYSRGSSAPPEAYTVHVNSKTSSYSGSSRGSSSVSPTIKGMISSHSRLSSHSSRSSASPPPVAPKPSRSKAYSKRTTGSRRLWSEGTDSREASPQVDDLSTVSSPIFPSAEVSQSEIDVFLESDHGTDEANHESRSTTADLPAKQEEQTHDDSTQLKQQRAQPVPVSEQTENEQSVELKPAGEQPAADEQAVSKPTIHGDALVQPNEVPDETALSDEQHSSSGTAEQTTVAEQLTVSEEKTSVENEQQPNAESAMTLDQSCDEEVPTVEKEVFKAGQVEPLVDRESPADTVTHPADEEIHVASSEDQQTEEQSRNEQPAIDEAELETSNDKVSSPDSVSVAQQASDHETRVQSEPLEAPPSPEGGISLGGDTQPSTESADVEDKALEVNKSVQVLVATANRDPTSVTESSYKDEDTQMVEHSPPLSNDDPDINTSLRRPENSVLCGGEITAPEVKSIPIKSVKHNRAHKRYEGNTDKDRGKQHTHRERGKSEPPTLAESKIHITVSSSALATPVTDNVTFLKRQSREELALLVKELQIKLREKDEDLARAKRQHDREIKEKEEQIKKFAKENKKVERDKWELLKRARDAAERSLHLRTQLDMKEASFRTSQSESGRIRDELMSVKSANTSLRALLSDLRAPKSSVDQAVQVDLHGLLRRNRSIELAFTRGDLSQEMDQSLERASELRMSTSSLPWPDRWEGEGDSSSLCDDSRNSTPVPVGLRLSSQSLSAPEGGKKTKKKRTAIFGRMRRSSGSKRGSVTSMDRLDLRQSSLIQGPSRGHTPFGFPYQPVPPELKEQRRILEEFKNVPFSQWTLQAIIAWMEAGIGMSQYTAMVREKVSSGNSLLGFTESDLEKKLGIHNPLHRRKLKLAIQDQRSHLMCQYPHVGRIDAGWVANEWTQDCGLPHLSESLLSNLVDGRVLNSLTKDDIRRYLKVTKKTDQISFLSGVELLRMHDFNRKAIQQHRRGNQNPFYWTNRDVCDWLKDIQLEAYANNVLGGGVHGALLFLERGRFTAEHLATILKIPMSKSQLRRHLADKLATLFTEDINDSLDQPAQMSGSPLHLSPHSQPGSQSPDRRYPSPLHISHSPVVGNDRLKSPTSDCPHPTRKNSLTTRSRTPSLTRFTTLTQPDSASPPGFQRTGSQPSVLFSSSPAHRNHLSPAELARRSLRESALRSVSSAQEQSLQMRRTLTPTVLSSTTV